MIAHARASKTVNLTNNRFTKVKLLRYRTRGAVKTTSARKAAKPSPRGFAMPDSPIIEKQTLSEDKTQITLIFKVKGGPFFDRWRGWIKGQVITEQIKTAE